MICEECHIHQANVFYTTVVNGKKSEQYLCKNCSLNHQGNNILSELSTLSLQKMMSNYLQPYTTSFTKESKEKTCETCKLSYSKLLQSGKVGCVDCYTHFQQELLSIIEKVQLGKVTHIGKVPLALKSIYNREEKIKELQSKLVSYVQQEKYEKAHEMKNQIQILQQKLYSGENMEG